MSRSIRPARARLARRCPRLDWLETRHLPSFAAIAVDPTPGAHLAVAPQALTVTFDHPIDPTSPGLADLRLARVADDGEIGWLDDATEGLGPGEDQLMLTPGQELTPGHYRLFLAAGSGLLDIDGEALDDTGTDTDLGDFWVVGRGVGLGEAIDLGTPGPVPEAIGGVLDLQADPGAVILYRITLPPDHFWRLGLEVSAQRDGGMLDSALALFDAQGRPIATDEVGRRDAPFDPYLFAGLGAGTYYIGVSGTGNLPGTAGGYDPATAAAGSAPQFQPGGPFTLHLVADPVDAPPALVSFAVDQADPLDATPTGLTLGFSDAIYLSGDSNLAESLNRGIEVVDESGHPWPIVALNYSEAEARVSFLFADRLPEGRYTVRLPERGGLTDLAGRSPVAPGLPPGVLGAFSVGVDDRPRSPDDRGALLPGAASTGAEFEAALGPGESASYRVVLTFPSLYTFRCRYSGGPLAIVLIGPDGVVPIDPGEPDALSGTNDTMLMPGEYQIRMTAAGSGPVRARVILRAPAIWEDLVLANGVGQGPALSLRLIAPPGPGLPPGDPVPVPGNIPGTMPPPPPGPPSPPGTHQPTPVPDPGDGGGVIVVTPTPNPAPAPGGGGATGGSPTPPASGATQPPPVATLPPPDRGSPGPAPGDGGTVSPPPATSAPQVVATQPSPAPVAGPGNAPTPTAPAPLPPLASLPAPGPGTAGPAPGGGGSGAPPAVVAVPGPPASVSGLGGDLVGRPSAPGRPEEATGRGTAPGKVLLASDPGGIPEEIGHGPDPQLVDFLLGSARDGADVPPGPSAVGEGAAGPEADDRGGEGRPQLAGGWLGHLDEAIARWYASRVQDDPGPGPRDAGLPEGAEVAAEGAGPEPEDDETAHLLSPTTIVVASALLAQSHTRIHRWLIRRRGRPPALARPGRGRDDPPRGA